jgi:hypothetical protein
MKDKRETKCYFMDDICEVNWKIDFIFKENVMLSNGFSEIVLFNGM